MNSYWKFLRSFRSGFLFLNWLSKEYQVKSSTQCIRAAAGPARGRWVFPPLLCPFQSTRASDYRQRHYCAPRPSRKVIPRVGERHRVSSFSDSALGGVLDDTNHRDYEHASTSVSPPSFPLPPSNFPLSKLHALASVNVWASIRTGYKQLLMNARFRGTK